MLDPEGVHPGLNLQWILQFITDPPNVSQCYFCSRLQSQFIKFNIWYLLQFSHGLYSAYQCWLLWHVISQVHKSHAAQCVRYSLFLSCRRVGSVHGNMLWMLSGICSDVDGSPHGATISYHAPRLCKTIHHRSVFLMIVPSTSCIKICGSCLKFRIEYRI